MVDVGDMSSEEDRARLRDPAVLDALAMGLVEGAAAVLSSQAR
jgi:N-acetylmuramoyl-L-alanine amidase